MAYAKGDNLEAFDAKLAANRMRGQWASDAAREQGKGGAWEGKVWQSAARGEPYVWKWSDTEALLDESCEAIPESQTARRALIFHAPGLERSTTHTMNTGIQYIRPGELAWAHRHTISALRFVIEGHPDLYTVVEGEPCAMEPCDLILTPNWLWHDHHNKSQGRALWFDVLDGPLVSALNQSVFEDFGDEQQPVKNTANPRAMRYPWSDMKQRLAAAALDPCNGQLVDYAHAETGGPVLRTIGAAAQVLPAGFEGAPHRHSSSTVYLVVQGHGRSRVGERNLEWGPRDVFVVPAWARHAHVNASHAEDAVLFSVTDAPALEALGLYREDPAPAMA